VVRSRARSASPAGWAVLSGASASGGPPRRRAARPDWGTIGHVKLTIDPRSPDAPYDQLRSQIAARARAGTLPVGYRLPTVRGLAEELGLAPNTVAKTWTRSP
jgi:hypothetical protein